MLLKIAAVSTEFPAIKRYILFNFKLLLFKDINFIKVELPSFRSCLHKNSEGTVIVTCFSALGTASGEIVLVKS